MIYMKIHFIVDLPILYIQIHFNINEYEFFLLNTTTVHCNLKPVHLTICISSKSIAPTKCKQFIYNAGADRSKKCCAVQ